MNEAIKFLMLKGIGAFSALDPRPLNREIAEWQLDVRLARGAEPRGKRQVLAGAFLLVGCVIVISQTAMVIPMVLSGIVDVLLCVWMIAHGVSSIRRARQNAQAIADGRFYLKETYVTKSGKTSDRKAGNRRVFVFSDGEELKAAAGVNSDRVFRKNGKVGDRCYLLFLEGIDRPVYVFNTNWWTLQPDLASFVRERRES